MKEDSRLFVSAANLSKYPISNDLNEGLDLSCILCLSYSNKQQGMALYSDQRYCRINVSFLSVGANGCSPVRGKKDFGGLRFGTQ
jgi:hypothetical protein